MNFFKQIGKILFRILWLCVIIFILIWTWVSYTRAPQDQYLVVYSKLRKPIFLKPSQWSFIPERIIPKQSSIENIPVSPFIQGSIDIKLPYYKLLDTFGKFDLTFHYHADIQITEQQAKQFQKGDFKKILEEKKSDIEFTITTVTEAITASVPFTKDVLINTIIKDLEAKDLKTKIIIASSNDLDFYQTLRKDILAYDKLQNLNLREKKVQSAIKDQQEEIDINSRKDKIDKYLDTVIEMAQKIKTSKADPKAVLDILKFLINKEERNNQ